MTVVLADPEGFAVDWNWQRHLTVWALAGRPAEPYFDSQVLEHDLPDRPASEQRAHAAARRWWRDQGRAQAFAARGEAPASSGH
jgi:hypothetical protein